MQMVRFTRLVVWDGCHTFTVYIKSWIEYYLPGRDGWREPCFWNGTLDPVMVPPLLVPILTYRLATQVSRLEGSTEHSVVASPFRMRRRFAPQAPKTLLFIGSTLVGRRLGGQLSKAYLYGLALLAQIRTYLALYLALYLASIISTHHIPEELRVILSKDPPTHPPRLHEPTLLGQGLLFWQKER